MGENEGFKTGPQPGVTYPLSVLYCGNCSMPIEVSWQAILKLLCFDKYNEYIFLVLRILSGIWKMQNLAREKYAKWVRKSITIR